MTRYHLLDIVNSFDQRLLTIKSWGATGTLAASGAAFQFKSPGLLVVCAVAAAAFWFIESTMKQHQMRYYLRMNEIEVAKYLSCP